jgi:hypothetical protein
MHPTGKSDEVTLLGVLKEAMPGVEFFLCQSIGSGNEWLCLSGEEFVGGAEIGEDDGAERNQKELSGDCQWLAGLERGSRDRADSTEGRVRGERDLGKAGGASEGKASETGFRLEGIFKNGGDRFAMIGCEPRTGRTHQIRVHLEYLGYPIVGDKIYSDQGRAYLDFLERAGPSIV